VATTSPIKSSEDIQKVRNMLRGHTRNKCLFEMGLHLAFRGCDLLALKLKDVQGKKSGDDLIVHKEKKTGKRRMTTLNDQVMHVLKPLIRERLDEGATPEDWLFVSERNKTQLSIVSLSRLWKGWCESAHLTGTFGSHTGRKTKAYIMRVEDNMPIEVLMKVLNHSSPAMTLRYVSIQDEECRQFYMRQL
jgi:integrase